VSANAVLGYTDILKSMTGERQGEEANAKRILAKMHLAVTRMQGIVSEVMFLARARMRRLPFDAGSFDLRDFCAELLAQHQESERLRFECGAGSFPIVADALRVRQILENLLSNGLKYSEGPIVVVLSVAGQGYRIEVHDNGIGIPANDQGNIFEAFFRASNIGDTTGHGLGLCVVRSCVEQQGGTVGFRSDSSQGTIFTVDLPASPSPLARVDDKEVHVSHPVENISGRPRRLEPSANPSSDDLELTGILVDDDPLVRGVVRDLLESSGQIEIVGEASSITQARFLVRQQEPDVVLLDVNLPDGSGFDLLPDLPEETQVVFVTSAEDHGAHAFDCEATDYLLKPVDSARLQKALQRVRQRLAAKAGQNAPVAGKTPGSFLITTLNGKRFVKVDEIKSILAYGEYSRIYWQNDQKGALLRKSLKQWQSELPSDLFVRVHRRAIVNLAWLERIERTATGRMQVHLREATEPILVSLRMASDLNLKLKQFGR
jgi:two-component system LytT family response regulator